MPRMQASWGGISESHRGQNLLFFLQFLYSIQCGMESEELFCKTNIILIFKNDFVWNEDNLVEEVRNNIWRAALQINQSQIHNQGWILH